MMRPSTLLWIALAGGVGVGVYQLKHRVQALEDEMFRLNRGIVHEQDSIHILRAEWAYINQPQRLETLAQRHLAMQAMTPAQMGQVADLPQRPPPPAAPLPAPPQAPLLATLPAGSLPAAAPAAAQARPDAPPTNTQTAGRAPAEGRVGTPAARAPAAALAPNSRPPAPARQAEPSIAELLATMRPPPSLASGDAYAGRDSPPAARMPAPRASFERARDVHEAGGPAALGGR